MAIDWPSKTLQEISAPNARSFAMGPFGSNIRKENYRSAGVPVIRGLNLNAERFYDEGFVFLTEEKADELRNSSAFPQDIAFVAQGTIGQVGIIPKHSKYPKYVLSQNLMKVTCDTNKIDPLYVFYYFRSHYGQHEIFSYENPTGVPCISQPLTSLKSFRVPVPALPVQHGVAAVLGSLDDKIELNRQMNQTLEAMAQALFKSWFVDFDPFRDEDMVDSPLGLIPNKWQVGSVGQIAINERRGADPSTLDDDTPYIGLEHMPRGSIVLNTWEAAAKVTSNKFAFRHGEILFGKLRPYFKKVGVALTDGVCSTDILVIRPATTKWFSFLICQLSRQEFIDYTEAVSSGTKMPRVNWGDMAKYKVPLPSPAIADNFDQCIRPLINRMEANTMGSQTLASIRDTLLPKLLSGEIRVKDAEKLVENAV